MKSTNSRTLSSVLMHFKNADIIKASTIEHAFLCSETTAYGMLRGEADERFTELRHAFDSLPAEVSDAIRGLLFPDREIDVDFNRDGRIDKSDVIVGLTMAAKRTVEGLEEALKSEGSTFTAEKGAGICNDLDSVTRMTSGVRNIVSKLTVSAMKMDQRSA